MSAKDTNDVKKTTKKHFVGKDELVRQGEPPRLPAREKMSGQGKKAWKKKSKKRGAEPAWLEKQGYATRFKSPGGRRTGKT